MAVVLGAIAGLLGDLSLTRAAVPTPDTTVAWRTDVDPRLVALAVVNGELCPVTVVLTVLRQIGRRPRARVGRALVVAFVLVVAASVFAASAPRPSF